MTEKLKAERDLAIKEITKYAKEAGYLAAENDRLREALEEIANGKPPKSIYGEGIYWWCVETAKKALEQNNGHS